MWQPFAWELGNGRWIITRLSNGDYWVEKGCNYPSPKADSQVIHCAEIVATVGSFDEAARLVARIDGKKVTP